MNPTRLSRTGWILGILAVLVAGVLNLAVGAANLPPDRVALEVLDRLPLIALDSGLTELQLIEHLRAAARDEETLELYLADLYADLLAHVHGDPLPTFE